MKIAKKNLEESIYYRLKNIAKSRERPVQEILKYYAMERFLYRLSISPYQKDFYLKRGLMLMVWSPNNHRATIDIDLLAKTSNSIENLRDLLHAICEIQVDSDGIKFDPATLKLSETQLGAEYHEIHANFLAQLFTAKLPIRIDFGFSDMILPAPAIVRYPTILDLPSPQLKGYTPQTSIAEKFESIIHLGLANTRMKDFYDIWLLIQQFDFNPLELRDIIYQVIKNRQTTVQLPPIAFSEAFYDSPSKKDTWKAFLTDIAHDDISLEKVIKDLNKFFSLVLAY